MKIFVNKAVQWNDGSRSRTGKVKQILGDHVIIKADTGEEYIVNKTAVGVVTKVASSGTTIVTAGPQRYRHDIGGSEFLGRYGEFDLWYCRQGGTFPTVAARYGDSSEQMYLGATSLPSIREAASRAKQRGLPLRQFEGLRECGSC